MGRAQQVVPLSLRIKPSHVAKMYQNSQVLFTFFSQITKFWVLIYSSRYSQQNAPIFTPVPLKRKTDMMMVALTVKSSTDKVSLTRCVSITTLVQGQRL
jgi:hypothetical protein